MTTNKIIQAAQFAAKAHAGIKRKYTGRPYIEHPARVAGRVMTIPHVTEDVVAAAWMHDVLEDTDLEIPAIFSPWCYHLVVELTNPSKKHPHLPRAERKAMDREYLRQGTHWAKVIKIIDRIDNLRDMREAPIDFRVLYVRESMLLREALIEPRDGFITELTDELLTVINESPYL